MSILPQYLQKPPKPVQSNGSQAIVHNDHMGLARKLRSGVLSTKEVHSVGADAIEKAAQRALNSEKAQDELKYNDSVLSWRLNRIEIYLILLIVLIGSAEVVAIRQWLGW